jgi:hypothetical protein
VTGRRNGPVHWHLDVRGRRSGPHDWTVILELARSGMLGPDDLLWCSEFTNWKRVDEFPELTIPPTGVGSPGTDPIERDARNHPRPRLAIAFGLVWAALAFGAVALVLSGLPGIQDGVLGARLQVFVPLVLLALGVWVVWTVWVATRPDGLLKRGVLRGAVRVPVAISAFCLLVFTLSTFINARDIFLVALGRDPLGRADLLVLAGGTELEVRGVLGAGTASRFAKALAENPRVRFVHLNSTGGWVTEGEVLAKLIRAHKLGTYSATGCYSACVLAFIAGSPRVLNPEARLGLHSTSGEGMDPCFIERLNEDYQGDLRRAGASEEFVRQATASAATDLWMPDPVELTVNHLLDRVAAGGFAASGEPLTELAAPAARFEERYAFIQLVAHTDPVRFAQFDRAIRLALRHGALPLDLQQYTTDLAAEVEMSRLATVADDTVENYARGLRSAARQFAAIQPSQCVAILGRNRHDLAQRSNAALSAIDGALHRLLAAPVGARQSSIESDGQALSTVIHLAATHDRIRSPGAEDGTVGRTCARLISMFDLALNANKGTAAGFMRALRDGAGVYLPETPEQ